MRGESETGRQMVLTILFKKFSVNKSHAIETDVCVWEGERDRERERIMDFSAMQQFTSTLQKHIFAE